MRKAGTYLVDATELEELALLQVKIKIRCHVDRISAVVSFA